MAIPVETKQPGEIRPLTFDFDATMPEGLTIAAVLSIISVPQGEVAGSTNIAISNITSQDRQAQCLAAGGTANESYTVTATVSAGTPEQRYEIEGVVYVRDYTAQAMTLIVEDGSGVANANSVSTVQELREYWAVRGGDDVYEAADDDLRAALVQATTYVDATYGAALSGEPAFLDQALAWPRIGATDRQGNPIDATNVPRAWKQAVHELARLALNGPLLEAQDRGGAVKRIRVGTIEKEWEPGAPAGKTYPLIDRLLAPLMRVSGGQVRLVRG